MYVLVTDFVLRDRLVTRTHRSLETTGEPWVGTLPVNRCLSKRCLFSGVLVRVSPVTNILRRSVTAAFSEGPVQKSPGTTFIQHEGHPCKGSIQNANAILQSRRRQNAIVVAEIAALLY